MDELTRSSSNQAIRTSLAERLKLWQQDRRKKHVYWVKELCALAMVKWTGELVSISEVRLDTAGIREILELCYEQYFYRSRHGEEERYHELLEAFWKKILDREHSLLEDTAGGLDDLIVHFAAKENSRRRLSLIAREYLSLDRVRRETLEVLWKAGNKVRPEDAWLWEKLEAAIGDPETSRRVLLDGFRVRFGRARWLEFTDREVRQWQKILFTFTSRHLSATSFLRETWIGDILAGNEPEKCQAGWWGVAMIGAGDAENERTLLEVFDSRLKKLMADQDENHEVKRGNFSKACEMAGQKALEECNFMELQAMAHWKPSAPEIQETVRELWKNVALPERKGAWLNYLGRRIWWTARFRLEPEETMLKEVRLELHSKVDEATMGILCTWVPENDRIRKELLGVWEVLWESIPVWKEYAKRKFEYIIDAFSSLGISGSRLVFHLESLYRKSSGSDGDWPGNLSACIKRLTETDNLAVNDIVMMTDRMVSIIKGSRKNEHSKKEDGKAVLEMLRLAGRLPQPPPPEWIRTTLNEVAGKTCANWEAIRWEILAPRFNWQGKPLPDPSGTNHADQGEVKPVGTDSAPGPLPDLPEWLTENTLSGRKDNELKQIMGMLRDGDYACDRHLMTNPGLHEEIRLWLASEKPVDYLFMMDMWLLTAMTGIALTREGSPGQWQDWWKAIFEHECLMEESFQSSLLGGVFDCLKNEFVLTRVQKVLAHLPETEPGETTAVARLLRGLVFCSPDANRGINPPWNDMWASLQPVLTGHENHEHGDEAWKLSGWNPFRISLTKSEGDEDVWVPVWRVSTTTDGGEERPVLNPGRVTTMPRSR